MSEKITKKHHRTTEQIKKDYGEWLTPLSQTIKESFGGYYGLTIDEGSERVFSWKKEQPFKKPAIKLNMNRKPHLWTNTKEDLCLRRK